MSNVKLTVEIPKELFNHLDKISKKHNVTIEQVLHNFIKLGIAVISVDGNDKVSFVFRNGNDEQAVRLF